jgi:hypothetical protein
MPSSILLATSGTCRRSAAGSSRFPPMATEGFDGLPPRRLKRPSSAQRSNKPIGWEGEP